MQLGNGQKSQTLGGMGRDLPLSLSVRSRLDKMEGYSGNIDILDLRLSFLDKTISRFDKIEGEARTSINLGDYGTNDINMSTIPGLSYGRLDEIITMLNEDVAGRYLFGGNVTDKPPVKETEALLNGEGGRLGYKQILSNRLKADQGADMMGRLVLPPYAGGGVVTLGEDGPTHPFGFKLSTISTTGEPEIAVTQPTGSPSELSVTFTDEPMPGDVVTFGLTLPDGTETQITLTATADETPAPGMFYIGSTGRLVLPPYVAGSGAVTLQENGPTSPFGSKLSSISTTGAPAIEVTQSTGSPSEMSVNFTGEPVAGNAVTFDLTQPDGTTTQITLTATTDDPAPPGTFTINADHDIMASNFQAALEASLKPNDNNIMAGNFQAALEASLKQKAGGELAAASTYAAANDFFAADGVPQVVVGTPETATALTDADPSKVVFWYDGQTSDIQAEGLGRTNISTATDTVTLARTVPTRTEQGFQSLSLSSSAAGITIDSTNPDSVSAQFTTAPTAGDMVTVDLVQPDGTTRSFSLKAVNGPARPGEFTIGTGPNAINDTAASFGAALKDGMTNVSRVAEGDPRANVTARVDDSTEAKYGIQANESGLLKLLRTQAAMTVTTYPTEAVVREKPEIEQIRLDAMALTDETARTAKLAEYEAAVTQGYRQSRELFDGMAVRQQGAMSGAHDPEPGSIERIAMDLSIAQVASHNAAERHANYGTQLENLLSDVETVPDEQTAMEILKVQTQLQASYQVTAMVAKLSLVNYM